MKTLISTIAIILILILSSYIASAKGEIYVSAKGRCVKLTAAHVSKVQASHNQLSKRALANVINGGSIRNNDAADAILTIIGK